MPRRHRDEDEQPSNADVMVRVVKAFTHYPDGRRQDETVGGELSIPPDVAERWTKLGYVEYL